MPAKKKSSPKKPEGAMTRTHKTKHDYVTAQKYYVEGMPTDPDEPDGDRDWPNLRVLSERLNIPYSRLRERSSRDRWTTLRNQHQQNVAQERQKERVKHLGKESIEFDNRGLDIAKIGLQLIGVRMGEIAAMVKASKANRDDAMQRLQNGEPVEKQELWSQIRADEMERLAKAAATLQDIGRKSLGTDVTQVQVDGGVQVTHAISVAQELERDDPDRLAAFMAAADRAGLWEQLELAPGEDGAEDEDIVDGEIVDDDGEDERA